MLVLLIAIVLIVLGFVAVITIDNNKKSRLCGTILLSVGISLAVHTFLTPVGTYEEPELLSTKQISSYETFGIENYYIDSNEFITYFEITEIISKDSKEIEPIPTTRLKTQVEIIPEKNCKIPRVEECLIKYKESFWTFAKGKDKTVYKIYIPE